MFSRAQALTIVPAAARATSEPARDVEVFAE